MGVSRRDLQMRLRTAETRTETETETRTIRVGRTLGRTLGLRLRLITPVYTYGKADYMYGLRLITLVRI